jgi:hypothetical protein
LKLKNNKKNNSGWYNKHSIKKCFFRFLNVQPELRKFIVIPLLLIIILLEALIFIFPIKSLLENLLTTLVGIFMAVTLISFIQFRENQRRFFPIFHKIIIEIIEVTHKFIKNVFVEFLEPHSSSKKQVYYSFIIESYDLLDSYRRYLKDTNSLMKSAKELITEIDNKDEIQSAELFIKEKNIFIEKLNEIKKSYLSNLDFPLLKVLETITAKSTLPPYESIKPMEDAPYHIGQWKGNLLGNIKLNLAYSLFLLEAVKEWDQSLEKTVFDCY